MSKSINPSTGAATYLDVEFNDIYAHDDLFMNDKLYHLGDTDTYIEYDADAISVNAGGERFISIVQDTQSYISFNGLSADIDFYMNASGVTNAFSMRGSDGHIGINCAGQDGYRVMITDPTDPQLWLYNNSFYHASIFVNTTGELQINPSSGIAVFYEDNSPAKLYIASDTSNASADSDAMLYFYTNGLPTAGGTQKGYIGYDEGEDEFRLGYATQESLRIDSSGKIWLYDALSVDGDLTLDSASTVYIGDSGTDGTYKIVRNVTALTFYRRESGSYVEKFSITA